MKIAVIFGGISTEHEVSIVSAEFILSVLKARGFDVVPIGITHKGSWVTGEDLTRKFQNSHEANYDHFLVLSQDPTVKGFFKMHKIGGTYTVDSFIPVDMIFPILHGGNGENGAIQGAFELSGIPYVGCGVTASACGMDKVIMKRLFAAAGLPVIPDIYFYNTDMAESEDKIIAEVEQIGYPVFVKPANTGSSVGISKAHNREELISALNKAFLYDVKVQVEHGIDNPCELEVAVLGNREPIASVPGEIAPSNEFYDYDAKYESGTSLTLIPASIPEKTQLELRHLAKRGFLALGCEGLARVDFLMERDTGKIFLNELNTMPGFTSISMYPKLWAATGISSEELLERLIYLADSRYQEKKRLESGYGSASQWYRKG